MLTVLVVMGAVKANMQVFICCKLYTTFRIYIVCLINVWPVLFSAEFVVY